MATCGAAVDYSRYPWQLNYLPPLLALWGLSLYVGCVQGKRSWLAPNLVLIALVTLLHPTGLLLLPITVVGLLLAPSRPRLGEYVVGAVSIAALLLPTIVWEALSSGSDISQLLRYTSSHAVIDLGILHQLYRVVGPPTYPDHGWNEIYAAYTLTSPYAALGPVNLTIGLGIVLLYAGAYLIVAGLVIAPAYLVWRARVERNSTWWRQIAHLASAVWRGLRANPVWRAYLLLWLWVTLPLAAVIRHSSSLHPHYLLVFYPAVFVMAGVGVSWALDYLPALARWIGLTLQPSQERVVMTVARAAIVLATGLLIVGQAAQSALYIASQASGQVDNTGFGYPLGEAQAADRRLSALQRQEGAAAVFVSSTPYYYRGAVDYLFVREEPDRVGIYGDCLALPVPDSRPILVASTSAGSRPATLLGELPNASHVTDISMPGNPPIAVYRLRGAPPPLSGETPVTPAIFRDAAGNGLRLEAAALEAPGVLRLRWRVLASTEAGQAPQLYQMQARALNADGSAAALLEEGDCEPTRWQAGETVFTWLEVAPSEGNQQPNASTLPRGPVAIDVLSHTQYYWTATVGPLHLLSGAFVGTPPTLLLAAQAGGRDSHLPGSITPQGTFTLTPDALAQP